MELGGKTAFARDVGSSETFDKFEDDSSSM